MKRKNVFEIKGGNKLNGEITIQTSKNAILPIISASILCEGNVEINNIPEIGDLNNMIKIMQGLGCKVEKTGSVITLNANSANNSNISCELMHSMRSSLFLLGSMLNKFGSCMISLPGGCDIGKRPIDIHISAFEKLGVKVDPIGECIYFDAKNAKACKIKLRIPSVGATENIIQFACKLKGKTTIINAAREPEVVDLCNFLNLCGAKILGAGTNKITIYGVNKLKGTKYTPIGDRIVAGTIMCAVAICGGNVTIYNSSAHQNKKIIEKLVQMGCQINIKNDIINISREGPLSTCKHISTGYYPDFATDLQSLLLTVCCLAKGETIVEENLFENRFLIVPELKKMGAEITLVNSKKATITGVNNLNGTTVKAQDLRGGASLVLAGLHAKGKTIINCIHHIDRGYEKLEEMLHSLGANIIRK